MSKLLPLLPALLFAMAAPSASVADHEPLENGVIYSWSGHEDLPVDLASPPTVSAPDPKLGPRHRLIFSDGQQITHPLAQRTLSQFTIAFYLRPGRGKVTESLISCGTLETDGFLFYRMHSNWGFGAGDGTTFARRHMNRRPEFLSGKWQHLAVTFDRGMIRYYRDGLLAASGRIRARQVVIPANASLLIGGASAGMKPFQGSMAGIVLLEQRLEPAEIAKLMARTNP